MKCIIPSPNVKIVARSIHSFAKMGDELYVEPTSNELVFRTINSAQSAFGEFKMNRTFFSSFNFVQADAEAKCKISIKSFLNVFKNPHIVDKQLEHCEIRFKPDSTVFVVQIKYTNMSVKKYLLPILDSEKLEASFPELDANRIIFSSKLLSSSLKNFRQSEDEVTIQVTQDKLSIKNHLVIKIGDLNVIRTELSFDSNEFECYTVGNPTKVTFCLKELRAITTFAETSNLPITLSFKEAGIPIMFHVVNLPAYESKFVVSTLSKDLTEVEANIPNRSSCSVPYVNQANNENPTNIIDNQFSYHDEEMPLLRLPESRVSETHNVEDKLFTISDNVENNQLSVNNLLEINRIEGTIDSQFSDASSSQYSIMDSVTSKNFVRKVFARCFRSSQLNLIENDILADCSDNSN